MGLSRRQGYLQKMLALWLRYKAWHWQCIAEWFERIAAAVSFVFGSCSSMLLINTGASA